MLLLRRFPEAVQTFDRAIAAGLDTPVIHIRRASLGEFAVTGDINLLRDALAQAPAGLDIAGVVTPMRVFIALVEHDYAAATRALAASPAMIFKKSILPFIIRGRGTKRSLRGPGETTKLPTRNLPKRARFSKAA